MAESDNILEVANDALIKVGQKPVAALTDRPDDLNRIFSTQRDIVLAMAPWTFAMKRSRLTAAGLLDCSSKIITIIGNTDPTADTIADDGTGFVTAGFVGGDRALISGSGNNVGSHPIASVVAATLTSEIYGSLITETLTNDANLKIYAQPANRWSYKYATPSDSVRIWTVNERTDDDQTLWAEEGDYVVTNDIDNDQIHVNYISQVSDPADWSKLFRECLTIKLASELAMSIKESLDEKKMWTKHLDYKLKQAFARNADDGNTVKNIDTSRSSTGWQKAGR
ncbi:hypothetical protein LCGC14_0359650 [marine sediment metagenome]|uniref:Tail tubular protein n=1 Tax=marine sediment metagenome TaxID=412755 RepID=A0A0F9T8I6_9ZZZZ|nr:hypothetical protein [Candidatus Aminicenantes bacterium]